MASTANVDRWIDRFPVIGALGAKEFEIAREAVQFPVLEAGATAYEIDGPCANYLMCVDGRTRVFRMSETGREMLIYDIGAGGTCVLTTQCMLSGGNFPAESIAEERTLLAALPTSKFRRLMTESADFRRFVLDDYTKLLASLITLVDEVAFAPLEQRLARRLLAEADGGGVVTKTHQQLAADIGSVREVVSRIPAQWAEAGLVALSRGKIEIINRGELAGPAVR